MKPLKLITILGIAILISFPSLAFAKGKPPKPPVDDAVVYTVALTTGVFTFPAHKVTLNSREYMKSLDTGPLVIERPADETPEQVTWDAVIKDCAGPLVLPNLIVDPMVLNFDDWVVGRNGDDGNLYINLKSIRLPDNLFPEKEIQIILRLINDPDATAAYPPTVDVPYQIFHLDSYVIWGKPLGGKGKGKRGWDTCYHSDLVSDVNFPTANLVIEYLGPE